MNGKLSGNMVFESDIHCTGCTPSISEIKEFETEIDKQKNFYEEEEK